MQFYCPSRTYPAKPYCNIFPLLAPTVLRKFKVLRNSNTPPASIPMMASQRWKEYFRLFEEIWLENLIVVYSVHIERHDDLAEKRIKSSSSSSSSIKRNWVYLSLIFNNTFYSFFLPNHHAILCVLSRRQSTFPIRIKKYYLRDNFYYIHRFYI